MLIQYISVLVFVFVISPATWASSPNRENQESTVKLFDRPDTIEFTPCINEALSTPEILSQLSSSSHALLSSFASQNEYAVPFYEFALENYDFLYYGFDSEDPVCLNALIKDTFWEFCRQHSDQAQLIINQIVIPNHPFLSQVHFTFKATGFLDPNINQIPDIEFFLDKVAKNIFALQFSQILDLENSSEAQILFRALLRKAKNIFCNDPEYKYHHAFLANVPFHYFKNAQFVSFNYFDDISSYVSHLASALYRAIADDSKSQARELLAGILPSNCPSLPDPDSTYMNSISEYQERLLQPIDNSYLWDPQLLFDDLLAALNIEDSNFAPYLAVLRFLSEDSSLANLFRHYIAQNHHQPSNLTQEQQPLFWRSLVFSSFSAFSSLLPNHSRQISDQIFLLSGQNLSILDHDLVDYQFSSDVQFASVAVWGHTATVDLLLQSRADISAKWVGLALQYAVISGHTDTVDIILQRRTDFPAYRAEEALRIAAQGGQADIVDIILQRCTNISAYHAGDTLCHAAKAGHAETVDLFLRLRTNIDVAHAGTAFMIASQGGHTAIVAILLQHRADISANHAGVALQYAVKGGYTDTVDIILQRITDISAFRAEEALRTAAQGGHADIVDIILQRCTNISAYHAGDTLCHAAKAGHAETVDLFLRLRTNIDVAHAGTAFMIASQGGHTAIVAILLQRRTDIPAYRAEEALRIAAQGGHTDIVNIILQRCTNISAYHAGDALQLASQGGYIEIATALQTYIASRS